MKSRRHLPTVNADKALVHFLRESKRQAMMVDYPILDGAQAIGASPNGAVFSYFATPGKHVFTTIGADTEFHLEADLEAGRTYYINCRLASVNRWLHLTLVPVKSAKWREARRVLRSLDAVQAGGNTKSWARNNKPRILKAISHYEELRSAAQSTGDKTLVSRLERADGEPSQFVRTPSESLASPANTVAEPVEPRPVEPSRVVEARRPVVQPARPDVQVSGIDYGRYHALVIGNNDYQHVEKLKTAIADARAVGELLKESYGFKVTTLEDGTRAQIVSALSKYRRTLKATDNLLVYYAGHGYLDEEVNEGYWFPVDAREDDEGQWISNSTITTRLKSIPAKHVMVVSDSCYSGTLTRGLTVKVRGADYFKSMSAKRARVVLTSGGLEPVEDGGGGKHSLFAQAFLNSLSANTGVMDGNALFKKVKPAVMLDGDQEPSYGNIRKAGHKGGDFLFVRKK